MDQKLRKDIVPAFAIGYHTPFRFEGITISPHSEPNGSASVNNFPLKMRLTNGILAGAFESGFIVFDFSECGKTPIIVHRESLWNSVTPNQDGHMQSEEVSRVLGRTERQQRSNQSYYRSVLLAHVLLLENASRLVGRVSFYTPKMENISDAHHCYGIHDVAPKPSDQKSSTFLNIQVIQRSFQDLDAALKLGDNVLRALELLKLAHYRSLDHRFAESLVLSWTVCENIIDFIWKKMIEDIKAVDVTRMSKKRIDALRNSTTFNASVRVETLELAALLNIQQVTDLNDVRRARNKWLHSLSDVDEESSLHAVEVCARLISSVFGIVLSENLVSGAGGEGGGVPLDHLKTYRSDVDFDLAYDGT